MKISSIAIICIIVLGASIHAQNQVGNVLDAVEKNNLTLSALRKSAEAQRLENKTGNYLQNPEVEINYLWGNPSSVGNRTDFNVTQSFDFPTAYRYRNQISNIKNEQVELEYEKQRRELLSQARLVCYDLIYMNALQMELSERVQHAKSISKSYQAQLEAGESNILEYNKAQLNQLNLLQELELLSYEREQLLADLISLNGGKEIKFTESRFPTVEIPLDFKEWYNHAEQINPMLNWLKREVEQSEKQVRLNRSMSLPKFHAGYMSEKIVGEEFSGFSVGISIPLWENKNKVKYAKIKTLALEEVANDHKVRLYNQLNSIHKKASELQKSAKNYQEKLQQFNSTELLKKALDQGEISLIDYLLEFSIYYESIKTSLKMERELNVTVAELNKYL
ncbi:MAG TPA: TolC family protein [Marinilabiliaceae bacterium]|nr:TolC family protein [Marinilabiliaceae bacterium]